LTGLSKPTVHEVAEGLMETGYVVESEPVGSRPRRPGPRAVLLRFQSNLGYVLGIDIGANKILVAVADLDGRVVASERQRTPRRQSTTARQLIGRVVAVTERALGAAGATLDSVKAIGVGTPGVVDPVAGTVSLAPQLPGWEGFALRDALSRRFPCEVLVDNEVHLSLLAERWLGAARDIDDAFYVQLGVGIGGGILIGGKVYPGAGGAAGEIGYLPIFDGPSAGNLGPFERAAGGLAFAQTGRRHAAGNPSSLLRSLAGGDLDSIDAETVFAAAAAGDEAGTRALYELVERLARGIAAAIVVLNPATVILGGGISRAGDQLLAPLAERILSLVPVPPRITLSKLGDEAVALGGARMALNAVEDRLYDIRLAEAT
jgi:predicted NBD/HSP70 family sugar kinase